MARGDRGIPYASIERVLKEATKKYNINRVSDKAVRKLKEVLESAVSEITQQALRLTAFKNAATITKNEVYMAAKNVFPRLRL